MSTKAWRDDLQIFPFCIWGSLCLTSRKCFLAYFFTLFILSCPGFGQDRVNFLQEPGRNTAGRADPTWPNRAGYSIPHAVMLGSGGGELGSGKGLAAWEHAAAAGSESYSLRFARFVLCILLICIVVVTVPFVCCSVKLPLSQPTSFCLFLSILLCTPAEGGAAPWCFCCWLQPNYNISAASEPAVLWTLLELSLSLSFQSTLS